MFAAKMDWKLVTNERLKDMLVAQGMRARNVAEELCREGHPCTKNAVIGRAHRIGLGRWLERGGNGTTIIGVRTSKRRHRLGAAVTNGKRIKVPKPILAAPKQDLIKELPVYINAPASLRVSLNDLTQFHCRWPEETLEGTRFCGNHSDDGRWCSFHSQIAYRPVERRVR